MWKTKDCSFLENLGEVAESGFPVPLEFVIEKFKEVGRIFDESKLSQSPRWRNYGDDILNE